jgi:hypothetical protein
LVFHLKPMANTPGDRAERRREGPRRVSTKHDIFRPECQGISIASAWSSAELRGLPRGRQIGYHALRHTIAPGASVNGDTSSVKRRIHTEARLGAFGPYSISILAPNVGSLARQEQLPDCGKTGVHAESSTCRPGAAACGYEFARAAGLSGRRRPSITVNTDSMPRGWMPRASKPGRSGEATLSSSIRST